MIIDDDERIFLAHELGHHESFYYFLSQTMITESLLFLLLLAC